MGFNQKTVSVSAIKASPVALREVDREGEGYLSIRDSMARVGILNAINVREKTDPETKETFYEICDGLHRYTAALDLGLKELPVLIISCEDAEVIERQIIGNLCRVETRPVEYTKGLQKMFNFHPTMTVAEMAEKVAKSTSWIQQRLGLLKLHESIQPLVDDGKINVTNACQLSKLPKDEQLNYIDAAITMTPAEFSPTVAQRIKEIRDANKTGKSPDDAVFVPVAHLRKMSEFKTELDAPSVGPSICAAANAKSPTQGFALGVEWALSLDKDTVSAAKAKYDARKQEQAEAAKKRAVEKAEKKAAEATAAAQKAKAEAGVA